MGRTRELEPLLILELPTELVGIAFDHSDASWAGPWFVHKHCDEIEWSGSTVDDPSPREYVVDDLLVLGWILPRGAAAVRVLEPDGTVRLPLIERGAWLIALPLTAFPRWSNRKFRPGVEVRWYDAAGRQLDPDGQVLEHKVRPTYPTYVYHPPRMA